MATSLGFLLHGRDSERTPDRKPSKCRQRKDLVSVDSERPRPSKCQQRKDLVSVNSERTYYGDLVSVSTIIQVGCRIGDLLSS